MPGAKILWKGTVSWCHKKGRTAYWPIFIFIPLVVHEISRDQIRSPVNCTLWKLSTSWKFSLHFGYIFKWLGIFQLKFEDCHRNILKRYLEVERSAHAVVVITHYYIPFTDFLDIKWKLKLRILFDIWN